MIFGKKLIEHKMRVSLSLQLMSEIFIVLRRNRRDVIINVSRSSCKVQGVFKKSLNFCYKEVITHFTAV